MLHNKLALVTGAQQGIGEAIALGLAKSGANVIVHYFDDERRAQDVARRIQALGVSAFLVQGDFNRTDDVYKVIEQCHAFGDIDILINNAALVSYKPLFESSDDLWDAVMRINVKAPFVLTREFSQRWAQKGIKGSIVNITSISANLGTMYQAHYCAAKGAILQLTRETAVELGRYGIRVNAVAPGIIRTDANRELLSHPVLGKAYDSVVPLGSVGSPADLEECVAFLCSEGARYISGQQIVVDGGWSAHAGEPIFDQNTIQRTN